MTRDYEVVHKIEEGRFEIVVDGYRAVLDYRARADGTIAFTHTGVPGPLEGRGIGSCLVRAGLVWAKEAGHRIVPLCWFVSGYVERHPEYRELLA